MISSFIHPHNLIVPRRLIVAGVLLVSAFATVVGAQAAEEANFILSPTSRETGRIPVRESNRLLVTGIDLDTVMARYIPDYDQYTRGGMGPFPYGMLWRWRFSRDTDATKPGGEKRSTEKSGRRIMMIVGVFGSHREALLGADSYFRSIQAVLRMDPVDNQQQGYISWAGKSGFVRDNVFIYLGMPGGPPTQGEVVNALDRDLMSGADGISKGTAVERPVILGGEFPDQIPVSADGRAAVGLEVREPRQRQIYTNLIVTDSDIEFPEIGSMAPAPHPPVIRWEKPGEVVVRNAGSAAIVDIQATAMNDLCVVSTWEKKGVRIVPPEQGDGN